MGHALRRLGLGRRRVGGQQAAPFQFAANYQRGLSLFPASFCNGKPAQGLTLCWVKGDSDQHPISRKQKELVFTSPFYSTRG
jgi:hypothetical protein